jgi:hypothetical protein
MRSIYARQIEAQRTLAAAVRELFREALVDFSEVSDNSRAGDTCLYFHVTVPPNTPLHFYVAVGVDQFDVIANNADARLELTIDEEEEWVKDCTTLLANLLRFDLRIRVRKTWLLRRERGAIWIPYEGRPNGGAWNGDLLALRGAGEEVVFRKPWYSVVSNPSSPLQE